MKLRILLIISLIANLCLLALVMHQFSKANTNGGANVPVEASPVLKTDAPAPTMAPPKSHRDWAAIKSSDWKQYIKNLRATGCPEETVRDIIIADINKAYAARWRSMNRDDGKKYWISKRDGWWGHTKQKQFNTLEREKKDLIQQLLGVDADAQTRKYLVLNYDASLETRQLDFLPADKKREVNQMLDKNDRLVQSIWLKQEPGGGLPAAAQHELNVAIQRRKQDLANLLTPDEQVEYELRNSPLAKDLRRQLYGFEANEKEFREIFEAQKALHDKFADIPPNPTDEKLNQRRTLAAEATDKQVREALGERRYADYVRTRNSQYQQLLNFTDEFELPKEIANQAYDVISIATSKLKQLQADGNLRPEERQAKVASLEAETDEALTRAMGEKGLKYYKQNYGGWMGASGRAGEHAP